jgi:hypothetical protein
MPTSVFVWTAFLWVVVAVGFQLIQSLQSVFLKQLPFSRSFPEHMQV